MYSFLYIREYNLLIICRVSLDFKTFFTLRVWAPSFLVWKRVVSFRDLLYAALSSAAEINGILNCIPPFKVVRRLIQHNKSFSAAASTGSQVSPVISNEGACCEKCFRSFHARSKRQFLLNTSYFTAVQQRSVKSRNLQAPVFLLSTLSVFCFYFPPCCSRTKFGLPESEARFLQGAGKRRLRGLAVEKEGCKGLLLSEMEEVLVCSEGQLPVLVHQRGGKSFPSLLS